MDETLYKEVTQSIKAIFDLTARIDERVKMLVEQQTALGQKLDNQGMQDGDMATRISVLENRNGKVAEKEIDRVAEELNDLEEKVDDMEETLGDAKRWAMISQSRWRMAFDFLYKMAYAVLVAYLLYRLNFPSPKLP